MAGAPLQVDDLFSIYETIEIVDELDLDDGTAFPWDEYQFRYRVGANGGVALDIVQGADGLGTDPANGFVVVSLPPGRLPPGIYRHELTATHLPTGKVLSAYDGTLKITDPLR